MVASEVRHLAQRSGTAAKEIKELIGESTVNVHAGSDLVLRAGSTMDEILKAMLSITPTKPTMRDELSEIASIVSTT